MGRQGQFELNRNEWGLTPRQMEAMSYIARGYSRPEVCELMGIKTDALKSLLRLAYGTLDLANARHAVLWWVRNVGDPEPYVAVKDVLAARRKRAREVKKATAKKRPVSRRVA